jgi:hypothetical protein
MELTERGHIAASYGEVNSCPYGVDTAIGTGRLGIEFKGVIDALLKVIGGMSIRYTRRTLACWTGLNPCIEGDR